MLNWKSRYSRLINRIPDLADPNRSILEVGCGPYGLTYHANRPVTGLELHRTQSANKNLKIDAGSVLNLPYGDNSFDVVLCVDVIEHLHAADRDQAISEMIRVAKLSVTISCPFDYPGMRGEQELLNWMTRRLGHVEPWLSEHFHFGLPKMRDLMTSISKHNLPFTLFGNEPMLQHYASILLDSDFPLAAELLNIQHEKNPFDSAITGSEWDLFYSFAINVSKQSTGLPPPKSCNSRIIKNLLPSGRVYSVCHDLARTLELKEITNLYVGKAGESNQETSVTDLLEYGTRLPNFRWSELSGIYKIWMEGPATTTVGFCHYRRVFDFSGYAPSSTRRRIQRQQLPEIQKTLMDEKLIQECCENNSIIIAAHENLGMSIFDHYCRYHSTNDLCHVISYVSEAHPRLRPYLRCLFEETSLIPFNMFIMKWQLFDQLCADWFDIMTDFAEKVPPKRASEYQNRDVSFLAERVFHIWARYAQAELGVKLIELPIYFIDYDS